MPNNYMDMFGGGGLGAHFSLQDRDREEASRQATQAGVEQATRSTELANLYAEQNNPQRIERYGVDTEAVKLANENQGYLNQLNSTKASIDKATGPAQLNAAQQKYIKEAKQADIDAIELSAQQMAYSQNPAERAQGLELMKMHKDFVKLRETSRLSQEATAANEAVRFKYDSKLENLRSGNATSLENLKATNKSKDDGTTVPKMSKDNIMGVMWQAEQQFRSSPPGSPEQAAAQAQYQKAADMLAYYNAVSLEGKADTNAGKPTLSPDGSLGQVPARPPVQPPQLGGQSTQPQPQVPSIQDVMRMYPGKSEAELRAAMKKKYGVDLK